MNTDNLRFELRDDTGGLPVVLDRGPDGALVLALQRGHVVGESMTWMLADLLGANYSGLRPR
jgi:hypothetical protein